MATSWRGTRSRSSPCRTCGTDVVDASTIVAATPIVPLATMFHAAHSPGSESCRPSTSTLRVAAEERQQHGEQQERHLDHQPPGDAEQRHPPDQGGEHDEPGVARRTPRTAPSAWRRRRTRTARSPSSLHCGASRCSGPSWCTSRCRCAPPTSGRAGSRRAAPATAGGPAAGGRRGRGRRTTANVTAMPTSPATAGAERRRCRRRRRRSRRAGCRRGRGPARRRRCPCRRDLLQPVRVASWRTARRSTTSSDGDGEADGDERERARGGGVGHRQPTPRRRRRPAPRVARRPGRRRRGRAASPSPRRRRGP